MFYHILAPEDGHPTWEEISLTNTPKYKATPVNLLNKSIDMLSQKAANIYPSRKYEYFPVILFRTVVLPGWLSCTKCPVIDSVSVYRPLTH